MTLSNSAAIAKFIEPITSYVAIGKLQKALLKYSIPGTNESLAAYRVLSLMYDTHVGSLLGTAIDVVTMDNLTDADLLTITSANELFKSMEPFETIIRTAVNESEKFLPYPTVELLRDYNTDGSPLDRVAVATFVVMVTNLQE